MVMDKKTRVINKPNIADMAFSAITIISIAVEAFHQAAHVSTAIIRAKNSDETHAIIFAVFIVMITPRIKIWTFLSLLQTIGK